MPFTGKFDLFSVYFYEKGKQSGVSNILIDTPMAIIFMSGFNFHACGFLSSKTDTTTHWMDTKKPMKKIIVIFLGTPP